MLKYSSYQSIYDRPSFNRTNERRPLIPVFRNRKFQLIALLMILSLTCTGMVTVFAAPPENGRLSEPPRIVVMPGDTLWEIAAANKPPGEDIRSYIRAIKRQNALKLSSIQAGDILVLPQR